MGFKQVISFLSMVILIVACNGGGAGTSGSNNSTVPVINQNNLNLIFAQTLEENIPNSNLSVKYFNHSLLLGQLINQITAGQVE